MLRFSERELELMDRFVVPDCALSDILELEEVSMNKSILPAGVADVAQYFSTRPELQRYYLSGGTAYALQRGHRKSKDLDFFTQEARSTLPAIPALSELRSHFSQVEILQRAPEQIHLILDGTFVTFLAYPFLHHYPFCYWRNLAIADACDIVVQKAYTIGRRAQGRDYIDVHNALTTGVLDLDTVMNTAKCIYGEQFSPRLFLQQLTYTQDVEDFEEALQTITTPLTKEEITRDLHHFVRAYVSKVLASKPSPTPPAPKPPRGPRP